MNVAGLILDLYDLTPRDLAADRAILEKLGTLDVERLEPEALAALPDHQFGLVGITKKGRKIRRYPIHDVGHAKLAALYFSRHAGKLPPAIAEKVAARIHASCMHHGVPSPLGSDADATDASLLDHPVDLGSARDVTLGMTRTASRKPREEDYAVVLERDDGEKLALYYVGNKAALLEAARTFEEDGWAEIHEPEIRVKIAQALSARLSAEKLAVSQRIADYASTELAGDFDDWLAARRSILPHEKHAALRELAEKRAEFKGHGLGRALETFDRMAGLDAYWDAGLADPYRSCYAAPRKMVKVAGMELDPQKLKKLASDPQKLGRFFDTYGVLEFQRDPEGVFDSLPAPTQALLAASITE